VVDWVIEPGWPGRQPAVERSARRDHESADGILIGALAFAVYAGLVEASLAASQRSMVL
jgi:hypothetical protein